MIKAIKSFLFENKTIRQTVAKNTFWLTVSNFGGRLLKAFVVIYAARVLGAAGWGVFSYAVTLAAFFTLFVDPGINSVLLRDVAKGDDKHREELLSTTFVMKLVLIAFGVIVVIFIAPLFSTLPGAAELLPIVALIIIFDSTREFFSSFIRGMEKMEWEAAIFILTNLAIVIFGFIFLSLTPTAASFGWGYVAGTAVGALAALWTLRDRLPKIFSNVKYKVMIPIVRAAWPFAVTGALGMLLTNTDILIISWMRPAADVGVYSAAIRVIQVLYLIPMILQYSTLPILSRLVHQKENAKFRDAFERVLGLVFLAAIPLTVGGVVLSQQVLGFLFGPAYIGGSLAFGILMFSILVDYPTTALTGAIFAYDHQKSLIITSAIGGVANVVFDLLLIPPFGIVGSAIATLLAQILSNTYLWYIMKKINHFEIFPRLKKIIFAGIVMGGASFLFLWAGMGVILNIVLSAGIYVFILYLLRESLLKQLRDVLPIGSRISTS